MPSGQYKCKVCETDPFIVPDDEIGIALMEAHFMDKHPEKYREYLRSQSERRIG